MDRQATSGFPRGFILGLITAAILLVAWYTWGQPSLCVPATAGQPEEHCVREWVSALSGWAAVAVAVPTIAFLSKQVRDADRFHRQTIAITLERNLTLAKRMRRRCANEKRRIDRIKAKLTEMNASAGAAGNSSNLTAETAKMLGKLIENFGEEDLDEFEAIRFVGATYLRSARKALTGIETIAADAAKTKAGNTVSARELNRIDSAVTRADLHLKRLDDHARSYLKKWDLE